MGKFDDILICSDLDGTLLNIRSEVSQKNREAIEYFKSEGGVFSIVTGRSPKGALRIANIVHPNAPSVVFNGSAVYDFEKEKILHSVYLEESSKEVIALVLKHFPDAGVMLYGDKYIYVNENNRCVKAYYHFEPGEECYVPYTEVGKPWEKALFIVDEADMPSLRKVIRESGYFDKFTFMQSSRHYYEILPKIADKAYAISKMREIAGFVGRRLICAGDNENDVTMLKAADIGIAFANAFPYAKEAADIVLSVSNDEDAMAEVIYNIL